MRRKVLTSAIAASVTAGMLTLGATPALVTSAVAVEPAAAPTCPSANPRHCITGDQVATGAKKLRVGDRGPAVSEVKTLLGQIGIRSREDAYTKQTAKLVDKFQWKNLLRRNGRVNAKTWYKLHKIGSGNDIPRACLKSKKLIVCADQSTKIMRVFKKGKVLRTYNARFGAPSLGRTSNGVHRIFYKKKLILSQAYNNARMPFSLCFKGSQCIHQNMVFAGNPSSAYSSGSHGCIGLQKRKEAKWLYKRAPTGTKVIVTA